MASRGKKPIYSEARNIIKDLVEFFDRQKVAGVWTVPLEKATELAAAATGKSTKFITKIRNEAKLASDEVLRFPSNKRPSEGSNKIILDDFDLGVLKRTACEVYTR